MLRLSAPGTPPSRNETHAVTLLVPPAKTWSTVHNLMTLTTSTQARWNAVRFYGTIFFFAFSTVPLKVWFFFPFILFHTKPYIPGVDGLGSASNRMKRAKPILACPGMSHDLKDELWGVSNLSQVWAGLPRTLSMRGTNNVYLRCNALKVAPNIIIKFYSRKSLR